MQSEKTQGIQKQQTYIYICLWVYIYMYIYMYDGNLKKANIFVLYVSYKYYIYICLCIYRKMHVQCFVVCEYIHLILNYMPPK